MAKSYSEKVKAKKNKENRKEDNRPKPSRKKEERKDKFPIAPVVVIGIVLSLIVATIVIYNIQNDDNNDGDTNGKDNGGNGNDPPTNLPTYAYTSLENVDGGTVTLEQYKGTVIIVDMFATWCQPCAAQMDELIKVRSRYSENEVTILSVDTDHLRESPSDVREFKSDYPAAQWTFAMSNMEFDQFFPATSIPTLFVLDHDLNIVMTEVGLTSADDLYEKLGHIL